MSGSDSDQPSPEDDTFPSVVIESIDEDREDPEDQIINAIGEIGPWQWKWFGLLSLVTLPTSFPSLSITFLSASTDFWCAQPDSFQGSAAEWRNWSSPIVLQGGEYVFDQCHVWNSSDFGKPDDGSVIPCQAWTFDRSVYTNTIIQDFNLVCDRSSYTSVAQSVYFFGLVIGVFGTGYMADILGRRQMLVPIVLGMTFFGVLSAAMPTIESFMAVRFFHGLCTIGVFAVGFVWVMEIVGGKWQTVLGIGFEGPWVVGWFVLALIAYLTPDWKHIQLITSFPALVCVVICWLLPESPKWLLSTGRIERAERIVREAVVLNGVDLPSDWKLHPIQTKESGNPFTAFFHLFMHKNLCIKTLILYFNWFANSFVYYGLTLNSSNLGGTVMVNYLLNGLMEIPAYSFSLYILLKKGRKLPYVTMIILGGVALFLTSAIPRNVYPYNWPLVVLALIGKLMITGTFAIAYVYSAEIYPTVVRSAGVGSSSLFARIGGGLAPYVGALDKVFNPTVPILIFGATAVLAGISALFLPETMGRKLPDTIEEGEATKVSLRDGLVKPKQLSPHQ
eukprot:maker-scaffold153_size302544-snap-gene-0.10 protein:Tk03369 transcript:maker-scaffold153_size302544-snap-gene-0.10-mRNA-1 annotation:"organic cation"